MPRLDLELRLELTPLLEPGTVLAPLVGRASRDVGGRGRVLHAIEERPGLGFRELARRVGMAPGTLAHHMGRLLRSGAVWTTRHGPRILHFPAPRVQASEALRIVEQHALDDMDRELMAWLRQAPQVQKAVLEHFPDIPRSTVQHRLTRLVKWGFVTAGQRGRCVNYEPPSAVHLPELVTWPASDQP